MVDLNFEVLEKAIITFIRDTVHKNHFKNGIVGVSGGLDSAIAIALSQKALGAKNTFALLMPYRLSASENLQDGKSLCEKLQVAYDVVDISPSIDAYFSGFPAKNRVQIGNKCARERMSVLYDFSVRKKALVIGTSNKSELLIGYSTLWGDSAAAFMPIGDLYKTQLFAFAHYLEIPKNIIHKKPSADLWPSQTDEGDFGISYQQLDEILYQWVDLRKSADEIEIMGYERKTIDKIRKMVSLSQFKRTMPPVFKLQPRTVGQDFRYARDWGK